MQVQDRVILITGSAERVGKAIALRLAKAGARVVIQYRTKAEKARETANQLAALGPAPLLVQGDISKEEDWLSMREEILTAYGRIDVLVNNAAIFYKTPFLQSTLPDWRHFLDVNLTGVYLGCRIIGEVMVRQKEGKIINIADVAAEKVWKDYIPYCVSKAGVIALTQGLAKALAPHVLVNAIAPGTVLLAEDYDEEEEHRLIERTPLQRVGAAGDIAAAAEFLISGSDFITGTVIKVDGGRSLS